MSVLRFAALAVVLLAGGCARLPGVPTAYSALSPVPESGSPGTALPALAGPDVALPAVIIPGTLTTVETGRGPRGMNPTAALDASMRSRRAWEALRPADLLKPPALVSASPGAASPGTAPPGAVSPAQSASAGLDRPAVPAFATLTYDREATMDRLLKGGRNEVGRICSGC